MSPALNLPRLLTLDTDVFYPNASLHKANKEDEERGYPPLHVHGQDVSQTSTVAAVAEITLCVYVSLDITAAEQNNPSVCSVAAGNHNTSQLIS